MPRKMTESTIRKMQVPAYCPVLFGIHALEYRAVSVAEKKTIIMSDIPIMSLSVILDMDEAAVAEAMLDIVVEVAMLVLAMLAIAIVVEVAMLMSLISTIRCRSQSYRRWIVKCSRDIDTDGCLEVGL